MQAVPTFTFDPGNSSVEIINPLAFCTGCTVDFTLNTPSPNPFELQEVGDEFEFDFIDVVVQGGGFINGGIAQIQAALAFSTPSVASTTASGTGGFLATGFNFFGNFFMTSGAAGIVWDQPDNILFSDGTEISIALADAGNSCIGIFGCSSGIQFSVGSTTTLQQIPEPGALALIGAGILAAGFKGRRRLRA